MNIKMRREPYRPHQPCQHAGLLLNCGFETWGEDHPEKVMQLHQAASDTTHSPFYENAYNRWQKILEENPANSKMLEAKLENRLYLGMGEASPLEAGITLHQTYGVPFIPGTAVKGVLHHYAVNVGIDKKIQNILFGREPETKNKRDSGEAGYIIFNDAWWIPAGKALIPEMITVHYQKYYQKKGAEDTEKKLDFESPNPNPQIAIQGSFLFSVEGDEAWAKYAIKLMKKALVESGIGGKTSSGYGMFSIDERTQPAEEFWKNATIRKIQSRAGSVLEATVPGKTATVKWGEIEDQLKVLELSNTQKRNLGKSKGIKQSVTVEKHGNTYKINAVTPQKDTPT